MTHQKFPVCPECGRSLQEERKDAAIKEVVATKGELQSTFRALKPPFTVLFEEVEEGRWRATLKCAGTKGGASDIVMITHGRIPEFAWVGLCNHGVELAHNEEGPSVNRALIAKWMQWLEANRADYEGKWVAFKGYSDVASCPQALLSDETEADLQLLLDGRPDGREFVIMKVEKQVVRKAEE
jgi:hypothetical protein